ncbi:MAG: hypothetical protein KIT84_28105 [Labilithrix sp.]|nr:hypothetical protein [Labilithrix sp.]MCW5814922.1 hypothetical protein [Labilithrix sp.]
MWTLIRNGGVPPMLFILLTGLIGLGAAFHFALKARRASLGFVKNIATALLFGTLAATCADFGATFAGAGRVLEKSSNDLATAVHWVIEGTSESTSPGILGFSFLALIWLLTAVGRRRLDERELGGP